MKKIIGYYRKCDLLTMCGTASSLIGIMLLMSEHYTLSVLLMIVSGICDAFDGTLARKHEYSMAQSTYGVQLDSLSDVICFGVFPALITATVCSGIITKIICVFYVLCGVIRLAYFNTLSVTGESKKNTFIGVPITTVSIVYPLTFLILRFINYSLIAKVMPIVLFILGISFIARVEIPKVNVAKIFEKVLNKYIINFLIFPLFIILGGDIFHRLIDNSIIEASKYTIIINFSNIWVLLLLIAVLDILFLILNGLFKNSKRVKIIILILAVILMVINDIKYNIMGVPLELKDINYLNPDNIGMMGNAVSSIGYWLIYTIIKTVVVLGIGLLFILRDKNNSIIIEKKSKRGITIICAFLLLTVFVLISIYSKNFIIEKIYNTNSKELSSYMDVYELYYDFGFYQGIYINAINDNQHKLEGYSINIGSNILAKLPVFNRNSVLLNNKIYALNELDEEVKDALKNYEYVQYGSFYDYIK